MKLSPLLREDSFIAGSLYEGLIVSLKAGRVISIFMGPLLSS